MKHHDLLQGSKEWFQARAGIPTASEFHRLLTPATLKPSAQADGYLYRLVAERITGQVFDTTTTVWSTAMEDGIAREQEAVDFFELTTGKQTSLAGFCTTDDGLVGASPDRFANEGGELLEVKAPLASTHVGYLLVGELPPGYELQVQGQLFVTGARCVWFISYYPGLPPLLLEIRPDARVQAALYSALGLFCSRLDEAVDRVRAMMQEKNGTTS